MPLFLKEREAGLLEKMDDPTCDSERLRNTYAQFGAVNALVSGWEGTYKRLIRPFAAARAITHLLDVGSGGGDIPRKLAKWAARDGINLKITAIDPDERATAYAKAHPHPEVTFRCLSTSDLCRAGKTFDLVISNHLLHHLSTEELRTMCRESAQLSRGLVIHKDIERADLGYVGFAALTSPFFRNSFITQDGLTSIRRSYTREELHHVAQDIEMQGWRVERSFPFHLLLLRGEP